ncbi:MAG: response regulator, partial [Bacteroides sp.]|nr:response regulator [Bacteroides sp.]
MILIVDDNQAVLASLRLLFEREGFEVVTASGPEEALATVRVR